LIKSHQPIKHCYWVKEGSLLAGEYPRDLDNTTSVTKIESLKSAGISVFIDLTEENDGLLPYTELLGSNSRQNFPIYDLSVPESPLVTKEILDTIDHHIACGRMIYVHCWGGIGRTGVIIGCWLSRHGFNGKAALEQLHKLWKQNPLSLSRKSPETKEQEAYIINWKELP